MSIERIDYKCDGCGVQRVEVRCGVVELKDYYCVDCGLQLRATFVEKEEAVA